MFQRRFAILFLFLVKRSKVTKERSTCLKLHWLVKFALSNRATGVWPVGFVGEKVNVLIEKRKVSRVHVLSKA